jgi:predicted DCC family thiol-disulfide oxidoreductase YuxK
MAELTLLYDEGCPFCVWAAGPFRSVDGVVVEAIGSERGADLLADLTPEQRYAAVHLVDDSGRRRSGAAALPPLLRRLRGGRPLAWLVERFPRTSAWGYGVVSRHRGGLARLLRLGQARWVSRR